MLVVGDELHKQKRCLHQQPSSKIAYPAHVFVFVELQSTMWNEGEKTTETLEDLMRLPAAPPLTVPRIYHTAVGQRPDHARACPTASSVVTSGVPDHGVCGCFYFQRLADTRYSWNRDLMEDPTLFACMPIFLGVFFERSRACLGVVLFSFFAEKHSYDLILDSTVILL